MTEKLYKAHPNGALALLGILLLYVLAIGMIIFGANNSGLLAALGVLIVLVGWIPLCGLKVLRPSEALVLTLFGKYKGTIKEAGFYCVNPFCTAVNPASMTKLAQSGDSHGTTTSGVTITSTGATVNPEMYSKKISLKAN